MNHPSQPDRDAAAARLLESAEQETRGRTHDGTDAGTAHWWVRVRYDDLIAALSAPPVDTLAGAVGIEQYHMDLKPVDGAMVLVPREPTEAMLDAFVARALQVSVYGDGGWAGYARAQWATMLAAAIRAQLEGEG